MVVLEGVDGGEVTHPPLWQLCPPHMVLVLLVQAHAQFQLKHIFVQVWQLLIYMSSKLQILFACKCSF